MTLSITMAMTTIDDLLRMLLAQVIQLGDGSTVSSHTSPSLHCQCLHGKAPAVFVHFPRLRLANDLRSEDEFMQSASEVTPKRYTSPESLCQPYRHDGRRNRSNNASNASNLTVIVIRSSDMNKNKQNSNDNNNKREATTIIMMIRRRRAATKSNRCRREETHPSSTQRKSGGSS